MASAAAMSSPSIERDASSVEPMEEHFAAAEGCAREVHPRKPLERALSELGRSCAPGMTGVSELVKATSTGDAPVEVRFSVPSYPVCLRVGAVASGGALSLSLVGPRGEPLGRVRSRDPVALLGSDGPICVRDAGSYLAVLRMPAQSPSADIALQVWQSGRER
jgi:hypothetical protein